MKIAVRILVAAMLVAGVAACKKKVVKADTDSTPATQTETKSVDTSGRYSVGDL